jgi:hypothetical protein
MELASFRLDQGGPTARPDRRLGRQRAQPIGQKAGEIQPSDGPGTVDWQSARRFARVAGKINDGMT